MNLQLPAHLANRQSRNIAEKASVGLGATLPPHISIRGNTFTLVDGAGNEAPAGPVLDICVVDSSDLPRKRYYDAKWTPTSNDPPLCYSANGITPSRDAVEAQARTCVECKWNERGSATSAISGAAIKACRDEKWLAVLIPQYPNMLFQLVVTPGSFKNWGAYTKNFGNGVDLSDVVTRLTFQAQTNGVLCFEILGYAQNNTQYISADIFNIIQKAWDAKATDILVGRNDLPRQDALVAGHDTRQISSQPENRAPEQQVPFAPAPTVAETPATAPAFAPSATGAAPTSEPPPRRRRRTNAEIAHANAGQNQPYQPPTPPQQPVQAPFMPQGQPVSAAPPPAQGNASFGVQSGQAPNPEMSAMLDQVFGKK